MWSIKPGDLVAYIGPPSLGSMRLGWKREPCALLYNCIYTIDTAYIEDVGDGPELWLSLEEDTENDYGAQYFRPVAKPSIENLRQFTTKPDLVKENA